jgi:integrase
MLRATFSERFTLFEKGCSVDPPKLRHEEITPLDVSQARTFLQVAQADRFEALYVISLMVGLRMGEALGLKWSDVDLDTGMLRVNRQLQRLREGGGLVFSQPKNTSRRSVELPQRAVEALRSHRKRQMEEQLGAGPSWRDNGLVFTTTIGTAVDAQNVVNRHFKPLLRRAGLPGIRWHDLRHTCATLLLSRGTHPKHVQQLLGHASIQLTLNCYRTGCRAWASTPRAPWTTPWKIAATPPKMRGKQPRA